MAMASWLARASCRAGVLVSRHAVAQAAGALRCGGGKGQPQQCCTGMQQERAGLATHLGHGADVPQGHVLVLLQLQQQCQQCGKQLDQHQRLGWAPQVCQRPCLAGSLELVDYQAHVLQGQQKVSQAVKEVTLRRWGRPEPATSDNGRPQCLCEPRDRWGQSTGTCAHRGRPRQGTGLKDVARGSHNWQASRLEDAAKGICGVLCSPNRPQIRDLGRGGKCFDATTAVSAAGLTSRAGSSTSSMYS